MLSEVVDVGRARALRSREALAHLDYVREVRRLSAGTSQRVLARALGVSQPSVSLLLKNAGRVEDVRQGFSGAGPYEIAQRYAAGEISRDRLVDELVRFPYETVAGTRDLVDDLIVVREGAHTFEEVGRAYGEGLIDGEVYDAVLTARARTVHAQGS